MGVFIMKGRVSKRNRKTILVIILIMALLTSALLAICKLLQDKSLVPDFITDAAKADKPEDLLQIYMSYAGAGHFDKMYEMLADESREHISYDDFLKRNKNIYNGIEADNINVQIANVRKNSSYSAVISYKTVMDSIAGKIAFQNTAVFTKNGQSGGYKLVWKDNLIFPDLEPDYKVKVTKQEAKRGVVVDRNGKELAGWTTASSVGIIPGKLEEGNKSIRKFAKLLGMSKKAVIKKLSQKWVKNDSFVPVKTIPELSLSGLVLESGSVSVKAGLKEKLLKIPGVMITDVKVRNYPLGKAASHLTGYVQGVTAEDLQNHPGEGYSASSIIGRSGIEALCESKLKGQDGYKISIMDSAGKVVTVLAETVKIDGQTVKLTIDAELQKALYKSFQDDKSCSVAINPCTGEVLALTSTPSFDSNDFIYGMSEKLWTSLNKDKKKPLYNRFRQKLCPGSAFKPVIAAAGLETGVLNPEEDFGNEGLSWQKDKSWGGYYITTLHETNPANLKNALINSDNIYFAKLALRIDSKNLEKSLLQFGFCKKLPFEISVSESQFSNNGSIETEIQLADSGYGQGQVLVNPVHLALLYTGFFNDGNILKPSLLYNEEKKPETWIKQAFSKENADIIRDALEGTVSSEHGTGHAAYMEDILLAGKTGTAEIKASKEDVKGTELGWFCVFTANKNSNKPILILSMAEDVKGRGGSGYVVKKDRNVLEEYFKNAD